MNYFNIKNIHCPVDIFLIEISKKILENNYIKNQNIYYYLSLIFGILSGFLIKKIKLLPGVFFFLSYFFNTLYSTYIKKYKLRHVDNNLSNLITYMFILKKLYNINQYAFIIIFTLMIPTICNWGCQVQYIKKNYPEMYEIPIFNNMCEILCPLVKLHKCNIFGNGSLILLISVYLAYL